MAKTKISEFSTTPGNNTDINGINIAEGCAPSGINNAIRELMSDLKEWQSGAMDVYVIPQGTIASPGLQLYGDLDTGFYGDAANQLGVAVGGSSVGYFSASGWVGNVVAQTIDLVNIEVTNIKAKDGTTSISLADSTGIATFSKATVIETTDNTNAALRITQLGTGNALLVEDATNPDTTPTVIDQFGNVILGTTARTTPVTSKIEIHGTASELSGLSPSLGFYHWSATASLSSTLTFRHYPSGTVGTLAANTLGDVLGRVVFLSYDGTNAFGASIRGVSGAGGTAPSITYDASGGHNFTSGPIDVENLEVTNIKARDGTAAASIADSTGAITVTKDLTANGVTLGKGLGSVLTNTALGRSALAANTVGDLNTAVGNLSLTSNTGGTGNTAVGHVAMTSHQGGSLNTAVGAGSLTSNLNGNNNTAIGQSALGTATGSNNTAVGSAAGSLITNGNKNTIIGNYDGNQGGLDIRTASNYIVLSDGDGNPRAYWNGANATFGGTLTATTITGTQVNSDNLRLDGNTLSSTDTNGNIVVAPNGTGITTFSNYLKTGNLEVGQAALGTNFIKATDTNGGIYLQTNGTGLIFADAASIIAGNASATTKITTNGASDLVLDTNDGSNSGSITIQDGVNGNIVIAPNGTGQVQLSGALDVTNIEVTNIKAKDGTAALSIADSTGAVTVATALTANGGAVFNENGADVDFRVEGDTDANLIFADASTDRVGIGTSSPTQKLTVVNNASIVGTNSDTLTSGAYLYLRGDSGLGSGQGTIAQINANYGLDLWGYNGGWQKNLTLTASGNLGLGVTPSAWGSGFSAIDLGGNSRISGSSSMLLANNAFFNGTNWIYKNTATSASYVMPNGGGHQWFTAASGTAGNTITFTQAMTLDASGNLLVGNTSAIYTTAGRGVINVNGSSSALISLSKGGVTSTAAYLFYNGTDIVLANDTSGGALAFNTSGGTERARITSSGNFGIGTNNPSYDLQVGTYGTDADSTLALASTTTGTGSIRFGDGTAGTDANAGVIRYDHSADAMLFWTVATERARIDSGGNWLVGSNTTTPQYGGFAVRPSGNNGSCLVLWNKDQATSSIAAEFRYLGVASGSITYTNTAVAYNTSSDYRLKDNQQPLTGSGDFIDALKPKTWNWKADGSKGVGFVAHEVQAVSPGSVVGEKDAVDEDGNPIMQAMEYGSAEFIANIIAELQSLRARVAQLEGK